MKKYSLLLLIVVGSLTSVAQKSRIQVRIDRNVEVIGAIFTLLSPEFLLDSAANPDLFRNTRLMRASRDYFSPFSQHPAVKATHEMSDKIGTGILLLALYYHPTPNATPKYPLPTIIAQEIHPNLDSARLITNRYFQLIDAFTMEANVDEFFKKYHAVYKTALSEIRQNLPNAGFIPTLERYYGSHRDSYTIVAFPFFKSQFGMGWQVLNGNERHLFNIVAPFSEQKWKTPTAVSTAGYTDKAELRTWCVHEFGHSFVNPLTAEDQFATAINAHQKLFKPIEGSPQYDNWIVIFNEYVVMTGEIQVAEILGQTAESERLKQQYRQWTYLPYFNRQLRFYRNNRKQFPTFEAFLPTLIDGLKTIIP